MTDEATDAGKPAPTGEPLALRLNDQLGVSSSGAPRVEACIEAVMARHPTIGGRADQRYFEAVHQELAPLARELERLADSEGTRAVTYLRRARKAEASLRLVLPILEGFIGPAPTPEQWQRICALADVVRAGVETPNVELT